LIPYILCEKYVYILALEMASPGKQQCANCIGTLSFPIISHRSAGVKSTAEHSLGGTHLRRRGRAYRRGL